MTNKRLIKLLMGHCGMSRNAARLFHRAAVEGRETAGEGLDNREIYVSVALMLATYKKLFNQGKSYAVVHAWKIPGDVILRFKWND